MNVFSETTAFFAAPYLAEALDGNLYVMNIAHNNFFQDGTKIKEIFCGNDTENIQGDKITIIGFKALKILSKRIEQGEFKRVNYIISDTTSCVNYEWWNQFIPENNINLYIMPDIKPYCFIDYKPIYQYMKINKNLLLPKSKKLLITHSPTNKVKIKTKGTDTIQKFIQKLQKKHNFDFKLITGQKMNKVISEKSRAHIHIDQLVLGNNDIGMYWGEIKYNGAMGKSGLEGMMMDCCVVTGAPKPQTLPHFDTPPITWTSYDDFYDDLELLIVNEKKRNEQIKMQNIWVEKVIGNKEFYKKYLNE